MFEKFTEYIKAWVVSNLTFLRKLKIIAIQKYRSSIISMPFDRFVPISPNRRRPSGYYFYVNDYIDNELARGTEHLIYHEVDHQRDVPKTLDGKIDPIYLDNLSFTYPTVYVHELYDIRYWGHYGGSVITHDNKLISSLSPDPWSIERHKIFTKVLLPEVIDLSGTTAIISTPEAHNNYWHWTFDLLPRLHYLQKAGFGPDKIDHYLVNHRNKSYQLQSLSVCGIKPEQIIKTDSSSHYKLQRAIVSDLKPNKLSVTDTVCEFLNKLPHKCSSNTGIGKRLYLTRKNCTFRRVKNERALMERLSEFGFEEYIPDQHSYSDQRLAFSNSEIIIGPHGSAMTNWVYCKPGTKVIEFFSANYIDLAFWSIATAVNLDYTYMIDNFHNMNIEFQNRRSDIYLAEDQMGQLIKEIVDYS